MGITDPFQVPLLTVPKVVMFVDPVHVESLVFSTLPRPIIVGMEAAANAVGEAVLPELFPNMVLSGIVANFEYPIPALFMPKVAIPDAIVADNPSFGVMEAIDPPVPQTKPVAEL
jgi:hypothetical protein